MSLSSTGDRQRREAGLMAKRLFDVAVAAVGLLVLSPLFPLLAILIKLDSPGPVLYRGLRVGLNGRLFRMLKFRSMVQRAEQVGPGITADADPRVTRVGRFLRRSPGCRFFHILHQ